MNAILDTNVLVAGVRSNTGASFRVLELALRKVFTLHVSTPLLLEYEEVLLRQTPLNSTEVSSLLTLLTIIAEEHEIYFLFRGVLPDDDDAMLLELAIKAQALIITHNVRHFEKAEDFGIIVLRPQEFLHQFQPRL
ncbi:MAG: putative toxin-antitoxin system toxin component, PIN family [Candidatus Kapabacteria bacterium]|jgi:putative PIN family toxin of toxin-antitoxin system|nr:putative toxin-antitoxin system toxin component, PIN family [Candidatus Kapabacteria bacterium]